jgi:glutamyl-tRNA synthetase
LDHITPSAAQFNTEKLNWLNAHYIKQADPTTLLADQLQRLALRGVLAPDAAKLSAGIALYKERVNTLNELADGLVYFFEKPSLDAAAVEKHLTPDIMPVLAELGSALNASDWQAETIHQVINDAVTKNGLKFPKLAMPLRVAITGIAQSPSIDQVMAILGKEEVLTRVKAVLI